jgi:hypothetical protein
VACEGLRIVRLQSRRVESVEAVLI